MITMKNLSKFEDSLEDSYDKLSFIYFSLNSVRKDDLLIDENYAQHINKIIKSIREDLKFAKDLFYDTKLYDKMKKMKKKEIEIVMNETF